MLILLIIIQVILFILWLLFVFSLYVTIKVDLNSIKIYLFGIRLFQKKDAKFNDFIASLIPDNKTQLKMDIDLSSLYQFIHLDLVDLELKKNIEDYVKYVQIIGGLNILLPFLQSQFFNQIKQYKYLIIPSRENNLKLKIKMHFNVGTIVINYLLIRSKYAKKTYQ